MFSPHTKSVVKNVGGLVVVWTVYVINREHPVLLMGKNATYECYTVAKKWRL